MKRRQAHLLQENNMKMVLKTLVIGLLMISVTACTQPTDQTITTINLPVVAPNLPEPPTLEQVTWHVYDANDLKQLTVTEPSIVLFTLTQDQNKALDDNIVELQRYILQLKQTVIYYQNLYTPVKN